MALFDLQSWFGKLGAGPHAAGTARDGSADAREVIICSRDRKLENELKTVLVERGYSCSTVRNAWACRYSVRRTAPQLVIVDWRMGQNYGAKLSDALTRTDQGRVCATLALLPAEESGELSKVLELGFNDFVMLPLVREQLVARLGLIEERHRELDQMRALQRNLELEYDRFLLATGGLGDGVWDLDLTTETIHFSDRWKRMLGYEPDEIEDTLEAWLSRVHTDDLTRLRAVIDAGIAGEITVIEQRYRMQTKDGRYRWMLARGEVVDRRKRARRSASSAARPMSTRRTRPREAVRSSGLQDPLTHLPNRAVLMDRLRHAFARATP